EIISAHADRLHGFVDRAVAGRHDGGDGQAALLDFLDELHAVQAGHSQIRDHNAIAIFRQFLQSFCAVASGLYVQLRVGLKNLLELFAGEFVVFNDQNAPLHGCNTPGSDTLVSPLLYRANQMRQRLCHLRFLWELPFSKVDKITVVLGFTYYCTYVDSLQCYSKSRRGLRTPEQPSSHLSESARLSIAALRLLICTASRAGAKSAAQLQS